MANKENDYFEMFVKSVEFNCEISAQLHTLAKNYDKVADMEEQVRLLHTIEHNADIHFHTIYEHLNREFITPIEREDILMLAQAIDNVSDSIEDVGYALYYLNVKTLKPEFLPFVQLVEKSCSALKVAIEEFKKFKKSKVLSDMILEVNNVEEEGDKMYYKRLHDLFAGDTSDLLDVLKWREIYDKLEQCLDACENVADILEGIVLKNS